MAAYMNTLSNSNFLPFQYSSVTRNPSPCTLWLSPLQRPPKCVQSYSWNACPLLLIHEIYWNGHPVLTKGRTIFAASASTSSFLATSSYSHAHSLLPGLISTYTYFNSPYSLSLHLIIHCLFLTALHHFTHLSSSLQ